MRPKRPKQLGLDFGVPPDPNVAIDERAAAARAREIDRAAQRREFFRSRNRARSGPAARAVWCPHCGHAVSVPAS